MKRATLWILAYALLEVHPWPTEAPVLPDPPATQTVTESEAKTKPRRPSPAELKPL